MDGSKRSPHGEINMVCALDVHGHAHRRRVRNERMRSVVGGNNDARANGLLSQIILQNLLLDAFHHMPSEETNDRQVHARIHQTKRIASSDDTIKRWQILESATNNLNLW